MIAEFLAGYPESHRAGLLAELVCLDLEYRWKAFRFGVPGLFVEEYARTFPELSSPAGPPEDLLAEEYRVRHRWGDRPDRAEYLRRFGARPGLAARLCLVDEELLAEGSAGSTAVADPRAVFAYGDFLLRRLIGAGGFGKVYLADRRDSDHAVAVKFLRKDYWRRPDAVGRFFAEAELAARLRHEGIVTVHGAGRTPAGGPFLVMDLVRGPDLARVRAAGPVTTADALRWTTEACRAVAHAYRAGLIHCDLKPSNLLLGPDGRIRVTDFGLACSVGDEKRGIGGTAGFMAPEQLEPRIGSVGPAADVYGLGAVLYALVTGRLPEPSIRSVVESLDAAGLPADVVEICMRCLSRESRDRFPHAADLLESLDAAGPLA